MTDSDSDCLASGNNLFRFPNDSTIIRARGPFIDNTLNLHFNTNSLIAPRNIERGQGHTDMSMLPRNFQSSFRGFAQSSMVSGRALSPTHSLCSNMSTSESVVMQIKAVEAAWKSIQDEGRINTHEMRTISEAYNKLGSTMGLSKMGCIRKRKPRRRHHRPFLKGPRRKSGYDSGEQASDSSISSDDCQSTRTGITVMKGCRHYQGSIFTNSRGSRSSDDARSSQTDINELRKTIRDKTMCKDRSNHIKQDTFRNIFSLGHRSANIGTVNKTVNPTGWNTLQKDRFKNSFMLPSQRFGRKETVPPIPEECSENNHPYKVKKKPEVQIISQRVLTSNNHKENYLSDSEHDGNMFSEATDPENSILKHPEHLRKRNLNCSDDSICSENKKAKLTFQNNVTELITVAPKYATNDQEKEICNDFIFAKPQMPLRKTSNTKKTVEVVKEQVKHVDKIHKSQPLSPIKKPTQERTSLDEQSVTMASVDEVSMRPSFMKRKLFTQTLDVTENKNSAESSPSGSPAKGYSELWKEKNKARKLVTNQSCLSRDITSDGNNLLDLIHRIVPPDRMNVTTNITQKIDKRPPSTEVTNNDLEKPADKWDITTILANCRADDHSDTYTDEEIFVVHDKKDSKTQTSKKPSKQSPTKEQKATKKCSVVLEKCNGIRERKDSASKLCRKSPVRDKPEETKKTVYNYAHEFWNLDSESESQDTPKQQGSAKKLNGNARLDSKTKNSNVVKNIKSVLDVTNSNDVSLEDVGSNIQKLTSDKSLRVKAAKALMDVKLNSPKHCQRAQVQQSICNTLNLARSTRSTSFVKSTPKKTSKKKEIKSTHKAQSPSPKTTPVIKKNGTNNKNKLNITNKFAPMSFFNKEDSESPHLNFTKRGRGRPRKTGNTTVSPQKPASTSLQNDSVLPSLAKRGRGRPRTLSKTANTTLSSLRSNSMSLQNDSALTKRGRGRPRTLNKTANTTSSSLRSNSTSLQNDSALTKRGRGRPRKVNNTSTTTLTAPSERTNDARNNNSKSLETAKAPSTNKNSRTKVLETPIKSNVDLSSKLKATKSMKDTTATNNSKVNKKTNDQKQEVSKVVKDSKNPQSEDATKESSRKVLKNDNLDNHLSRRTRSSRDKSFVGPTGRAMPKNVQVEAPKTKAPTPKPIEKSRTSNKENTINISAYEKPRRVVKNTSAFQCCGEQTIINYLKPPNTPLQKTNARSQKLVKAASPSISMRSFRSVRDKPSRSDRRDSKKLSSYNCGLGIAKATIGVVPYYYKPEQLNNTIIDDDARSITIRSMTSTTSFLSRGRRQFIHVR